MKLEARAMAPFFAAAFLLVAETPRADVQRALALDPSVRAAGMGGVGTAVFWSDDLDEWANPALLGYRIGSRYRWSQTGLVRGFPGVAFRSHRFDFGGAGLGIGASSNTLDYGSIDLTDPQGTTIGRYRPLEYVWSQSIGFSISQLVMAIASASDHPLPALAQHADIALGFADKSLKMDLAPSGFGSTYQADARDRGLLIRLSPVPQTSDGRWSLGMAYGYAAQNYDWANVSYAFPAYGAYPFISPIYRHGLAARVRMPVALTWDHGLAGWFARGMDPFLSLSLAMDFGHVGTVSAPSTRFEQLGAEFDLGDVLTLRAGHVGSEAAGLDGYTYGLAVGLPIEDFVALKYDFASYPQAPTLGRLQRHSITASFDPVALVRH